MNYLPFIIYVIIVIISYLYDIFGNGINKISYNPSDKEFTIFGLVSNIFVGFIIYFTCYIGYQLLPVVLTTIFVISFITIIIFNMLKIKIKYNEINNE
jgi:hypothetical protein